MSERASGNPNWSFDKPSLGPSPTPVQAAPQSQERPEPRSTGWSPTAWRSGRASDGTQQD